MDHSDKWEAELEKKVSAKIQERNKKAQMGTSLVVKWLRIHLLLQRTQVRSSVRKLGSEAMEQQSPCTLSYRAWQ